MVGKLVGKFALQCGALAISFLVTSVFTAAAGGTLIEITDNLKESYVKSKKAEKESMEEEDEEETTEETTV